MEKRRKLAQVKRMSFAQIRAQEQMLHEEFLSKNASYLVQTLKQAKPEYMQPSRGKRQISPMKNQSSGMSEWGESQRPKSQMRQNSSATFKTRALLAHALQSNGLKSRRERQSSQEFLVKGETNTLDKRLEHVEPTQPNNFVNSIVKPNLNVLPSDLKVYFARPHSQLGLKPTNIRKSEYHKQLELQ